MKKLFTALIFAHSALCCVAYAEQANKTTQFNWAGPFVGAYIGGAWGQNIVNTTINPQAYFTSNEYAVSVENDGTNTFTPSAFIGGAQLGGNWMYKNFVYGLALDYGSFSLSESCDAENIAYRDLSGKYHLHTAINSDWLYTVRGRLGWIPEKISWPLMIYATGGLAVTRLQVTNQYDDTTSLSGIGGSNNHDTQTGWTLGGGFEYPITNNLTINAEYLYVQFASVTVSSSIYNSAEGFGIDSGSIRSPFKTSADLNASLLRIGLNYKLQNG